MEIKQTYIFLTFDWSNPFIDRSRVVGTVIFCQKDVTAGNHARQAGGDSLIFNNFHQGPDVWVWAGCWQASWWLSNIMTPPSYPALPWLGTGRKWANAVMEPTSPKLLMFWLLQGAQYATLSVRPSLLSANRLGRTLATKDMISLKGLLLKVYRDHIFITLWGFYSLREGLWLYISGWSLLFNTFYWYLPLSFRR